MAAGTAPGGPYGSFGCEDCCRSCCICTCQRLQVVLSDLRDWPDILDLNSVVPHVGGHWTSDTFIIRNSDTGTDGCAYGDDSPEDGGAAQFCLDADCGLGATLDITGMQVVCAGSIDRDTYPYHDFWQFIGGIAGSIEWSNSYYIVPSPARENLIANGPVNSWRSISFTCDPFTITGDMFIRHVEGENFVFYIAKVTITCIDSCCTRTDDDLMQILPIFYYGTTAQYSLALTCFSGFYNDFLEMSVFGSEGDTVSIPAASTSNLGVGITIDGPEDATIKKLGASGPELNVNADNFGYLVLTFPSDGPVVITLDDTRRVCRIGFGIQSLVAGTRDLLITAWDGASVSINRTISLVTSAADVAGTPTCTYPVVDVIAATGGVISKISVELTDASDNHGIVISRIALCSQQV